MKRITIAIFLFVCSSIISCKDDEDPAPTLVGTWQYASTVASECDDPADNGSFTCTTDCYRVIFTETTVREEGESPSNYTVSGNTFTVVNGSASITLTFSIADNKLTVKYEDGGCKVVEVYDRV